MKKLILTVAFLAATLAPAMAAEPCSGTNCNKVPEPGVTTPRQAEPGNCSGSGCPGPPPTREDSNRLPQEPF